ncbi:Lrp/AsnC family transcriptional regulator [Gordonia sp. DT30]|uniref:Lrp/AsnC family transcriptional regulator n=1 Tax=unclassified Gordonia (in: high G+C Gram-positive bacteria) TaxID=2657482 RepID=UPI003CECF21B
MSSPAALNSSTLDELDAQIVRALQVSPRVSFRELGEVLGVAEQTVARRYRRMRREGYLRVTMAADPHRGGNSAWFVRVRCRPEGTDAIARSVAADDHVSWVSIYGAGWEVAFNLRVPADADAHELLVAALPKAAPILDVSPAEILHTFVGGSNPHQEMWSDVLTAEQTAALEATSCQPAPVGEPVKTDVVDQILLDALGKDGRLSYSTLARATGGTPGKVTRRVEHLVASGAAYFHVDLATDAIGLRSASLWLTVTPRHLRTVGEALGIHPRIPFAAAITGRSNIFARIMNSDTDDMYSFVTQSLAELDGITGYEIMPLRQQVKNAGTIVRGDRLAPPSASGRVRR